MKSNLETLIVEMKESIKEWTYPNYPDKGICEIITEILEEKLKKLEDFEEELKDICKKCDYNIHDGCSFIICPNQLTPKEILKEWIVKL